MSPEQQQRPLSGRKALITGASRGIGADIARACAAAGADLVLVGEALVTGGRPQAAVEEYTALGRERRSLSAS